MALYRDRAIGEAFVVIRADTVNFRVQRMPYYTTLLIQMRYIPFFTTLAWMIGVTS